jgi:hypothetical protein
MWKGAQTLELGTHRWLPVVVLTVAVLGLILTESILATRGTVEITYPQQNETISGIVEIRGSASDDNLAYYQLEYSARGSRWIPISQPRYMRPVQNGLLGVWDATGVSPGSYQLRLSLADRMGNHIQNTIEVVVMSTQAEP